MSFRNSLIIITSNLLLFGFFAYARAEIIISEIAWMGSGQSANHEWIELYNNGSEEVNLEGWTLEALDGSPQININEKSVVLPPVIAPGGFFLLERSSDDSAPSVTADAIYTGALSNSGEILILRNSAGTQTFSVNASEGWPAGDNKTKETMQLSTSGAWITAPPTPKVQTITDGSGQQQTITSATSTQTTTVSSSTQTQVQVTTSLPQVNIIADAGPDRVVLVGQATRFNAENSKGAEVYKWYPGDGSERLGHTVDHVYKFPGTYTVTLEASKGPFSSMDQAQVLVYSGGISINEFYIPKGNESSWIEISNSSSGTVDLGSWTLAIDKESFLIPRHTIVPAYGYLVIDQSTSSLLPKTSSVMQLFFPNGALVDEIALGQAKEGYSAARQGGEFFWSRTPTPSTANSFMMNVPSFAPTNNLTYVDEFSSPITQSEVEASRAEINQEVREDAEENTLASSLIDNIKAKRQKLNLVIWILAVALFSFIVATVYVFVLRTRRKK